MTITSFWPLAKCARLRELFRRNSMKRWEWEKKQNRRERKGQEWERRKMKWDGQKQINKQALRSWAPISSKIKQITIRNLALLKIYLTSFSGFQVKAYLGKNYVISHFSWIILKNKPPQIMKFVAKYGNWKIFHNDHEVFQNSEMRKFDIIARNSPVKIAE